MVAVRCEESLEACFHSRAVGAGGCGAGPSLPIGSMIVAKRSDSVTRLHRSGSCLLHLGQTSLLLCGLDNISTPLRACPEDYRGYSFLNACLFILRERERTYASTGGGGAGREGERIPSRLCVVSAEPVVGLDLTNCEIMT